MGLRAKVYVGPYVRCRTLCTWVSKEKIDCCPNSSCENHGRYVSDDFCSKCGTKKGTALKSVRGPETNTEDARGKFSNYESLSPRVIEDDSIVTGQVYTHIWTPNAWPKGYKPLRSYLPLMKRTWEQRIGEQMVTQERGLLLEAFNAEINVIRNTYGSHNVDVLWGIITYYS